MNSFTDKNHRQKNIPLKIHQLFERTLITNADEIAVCFGNEQLTYGELNLRANKLAAAITRHSTDATILGVTATRNISTIVALLAVLKAGKAYLPLDMDYPAQRLKQIAADARIDTCLAGEAEKELFKAIGLEVMITDAEYPAGTPDQAVIEDTPAYVLYTSGSTGTPKGVCMGNNALVNLLLWQQSNSASGPGFRTLQYAPLTFDVSFQEIFATLTTGGTLVLIDKELRLDPVRLLNYIDEQRINRIFLPFVALQYLAEAAGNLVPQSLKEVMTAGEQLKITAQIAEFFKKLPGCRLFNQYGPTESHVATQLQLTGNPDSWPALPGIGEAIDNSQILILDEQLHEVPDETAGELCIAGVCLADGYLNKPELTAEKFITWTSALGATMRIYRTGDLARRLSHNNIEYLGRIDNQVKIRGNRVEPGEIEVLLNHTEGISQAVVVVREYGGGQKRLIAYLVSAGTNHDTDRIKKHIAAQLPDYMVPSALVWLNELPKTSSGKVDRNALPAPQITRPDLAIPYQAPSTPTQKKIATFWTELLQYDRIGIQDNFFDLGGNSLLAINTALALRTQHGIDITVTRIYQFPTIAGLAAFIDGVDASQLLAPRPGKKKAVSGDIAVIGMAGRFPGAQNISEYWEILKQGKETTSFFTANELDDAIPSEIRNNPLYIKARGIIADAGLFDADFFNITPRMAELMDPQQRVFLEIAWEALEASGYYPQRYGANIGVFAGCANNSYYYNNVLSNPQQVQQAGAFQVMTLNEKDYISSRTAYQLDLKGPAVSVYSACSTSLLAIAQAVDALRSGYCSMALAGGATITSPVKSGHIYQEGAMLSADGHCRPFDSAATGTVFSDGAGVVLLKPLADAERDGDTVYAVIKGTGINNDGAGKGSFTAPSAAGQAGAIALAMQDAGIAAADITYIEAHGTATPLGDPIEIEGLKLAFGMQEQKQYCAIGSVKGNMGHLTAAAGVAGFIKTALCIYHKQLVPSLFFDEANLAINFADSPFFVNTVSTEWTGAGKRTAGVSSFGVGGTNVHVVLQEAVQYEKAAGAGRPYQLLTWSAKTAGSNDAYAQALNSFINTGNPSIADLAYTLQLCKPAFNHRRFEVAANGKDLSSRLNELHHSNHSSYLSIKPIDVAFMFPGQGAQYVNMGRDLYQHEPVFRDAVNNCAAIIQQLAGYNIIEIIYPLNETEGEDKLTQTLYIQPSIFTIEYALAKLWMSWGITPGALLGHSIGEFVAAHLAGVFELTDALKLITERARLINNLPQGRMLAIRMPVAEVETILWPELSVAVINSHNLTVVSGETKLINEFAHQLTQKEIPARVLNTSHALHSGMMDAAIEPFRQVVSAIKLHTPRLPVVSSVTGQWLTDAQATNVDYWVMHMRHPINFEAALQSLTDEDGRILLEVGPGNITATLARNQAGKRPGLVVIPGINEQATSAYIPLLEGLGRLWLNGIEPNWEAFYSGQQRQRIITPGYVFERKNYWLKPGNKPQPVLNTITEPEPIENDKLNAHHQILMRTVILTDKIRQIFEAASGINMSQVPANMSFAEAGFDSLLLTQIALHLKKEFNLQITFRKLYEEYNTIDLLSQFLDASLPAHLYQAQQPVVPVQPAANATQFDQLNQQLMALAQQVAMLQGNQSVAPVVNHHTNKNLYTSEPNRIADNLTPEELTEIKKPFGATARIERQSTHLTDSKKAYLDELTAKYNSRTAKSKAYTQKHRAAMADPRVVSGFRPATKEIVYPLVVNRSNGSRVWDIDGNEYIDALNGFGSNFLGYNPAFLKDAFKHQIENGYEIGPQHELAGEVCDMICEFTGFERAALCNTGSEAVLGAMRMARTVTGRSLIVAFAGSYHGINDEVLVRGTKILKTIPAAAGIMPEAVQNMLILDYGTNESLDVIRQRGHEIAAVLVEPVQSRRPEFQPIAFLKQLRRVTEEQRIALVFDEVITGFRSHPGGAQAVFGIRADIGTYGKVIGGGMPIGVIAGTPEYMDALDGGTWQYGDASMPEAGVTYFAGTFVRHPLALAGAKATLTYLKQKGASLQEGINAKTKRLADALNARCTQHGLPLYVASFASLWKIKFKYELAYGELLFTLMRYRGIHIWDIFPCFLTEAHTDNDVDAIIRAFEQSVDELIDAGFLPVQDAGAAQPLPAPSNGFNVNVAPVENARLGRDREGNPAWFIADPQNPGKYLQVEN